MDVEQRSLVKARRPLYPRVFVTGIAGAVGAVLASTALGMVVVWPMIAVALSFLLWSALVAARSGQATAVVTSAIALAIVAALPWLPVWEIHGDIGGRMHGHAAVGPPHGEERFRNGHVH